MITEGYTPIMSYEVPRELCKSPSHSWSSKPNPGFYVALLSNYIVSGLPPSRFRHQTPTGEFEIKTCIVVSRRSVADRSSKGLAPVDSDEDHRLRWVVPDFSHAECIRTRMRVLAIGVSTLGLAGATPLWVNLSDFSHFPAGLALRLNFRLALR